MSRVLARTVLAGGKIYPAGSPVPADVAASITADVWADESGSDAGPEGYDAQTVADLKAEIDTRNAGRDPDGDDYLSKSGTKADLVAALRADDDR